MIRSVSPPPGSARLRRTAGGFSLLEVLVFTVLMVVAAGGAATLLANSNRAVLASREIGNLDAAIEADLERVQQVSDRYTCCKGSCIAPSVSGGTVAASALGTSEVGASRACATTDARDDRYFFPQLDDPTTTTLNEPQAVDALCDTTTSANTAFLTPLKQRIDSLPNPSGAARTTTIRPGRLLRVTYTSSAGVTGNRVVRMANVVPPMANFCS